MHEPLITCRLNEVDGFVINEVYRNELYNIKKYIKTDIRNFIDIGAHIGAFSLKLLDLYPNSIGYCYEPNYNNFQLLSINMEDYYPNVVPINKAVSGDIKPSSLINNGLSSHNINVYKYEETKSDIKSVHIKDIQKRLNYIDLVKIDCEGGEHSIFENIDFSKIGYLLCEFHTEALHGNKSFKPFYKWVTEIEKYMDIIYRERVSADTYNFIGVTKLI